MTKPASSQPGTALRWEWRSFDDLDVPTLYALLQLRAAVFVVEQACAFQDLDDLDQPAWHCLGWDGDVLAASQRCLPPGTPYAESSIGRIVTAPSHRGRDLGRELVARAIAFNHERWPAHPIRIGAQARLSHFYEGYGFVRVGDVYMEDGIEHVHMLLNP